MKKWLRMQMLVLWGVISFIVAAGNRADNVTTIQFLAVKAAGLISFCLCALITRVLHRNGMLPEIDDE